MLVSFIGDIGSGKTLGMTFFASRDKRPVYSNYKIKIPNYRPLKPETLVTLEDASLALIDEAYAWLESRRSGADSSLYFSYILFQSRKRKTDIYMTNQLISTVDVRFRMMANIEVHCQSVKEGFEYTFFKVSSTNIYRPKTFILPISEAEKIYPLYDTLELINPIDSDMLLRVTEDKGAIIGNIDEIVDDIMAKAKGNKITRGVVSDYCLRHDLTRGYVRIIYDAYKARLVLTN